MGFVRLNVTLPAELAAMVRERLPGLNVSGVLRDALAELVDCPHHDLLCTCCGAIAQRRTLELAVLDAFYGDVMWELRDSVGRCETAEGAARVMRDVASRRGVDVERVPLPRPTKAQRLAARDLRVDVVLPDAVFEQSTPPRRRARKAA